MATKSHNSGEQAEERPPRMTKLTIAGFKSIADEQSIEIRPLTILAGANSSGKSSMMQPLLLLKQTLEAPYDPGPLMINGPNVQFTDADQLLSVSRSRDDVRGFSVGVQWQSGWQFQVCFQKPEGASLQLDSTTIVIDGKRFDLTLDSDFDTIREIIPGGIRELLETSSSQTKGKPEWSIVLSRFFLCPAFRVVFGEGSDNSGEPFPIPLPLAELFEDWLQYLIHVPALRGNPKRTYQQTAVGPTFFGTFDSYVASIIAKWHTNGNDAALDGMNADLKTLRLTWKAEARQISDAEVEIRVGRLPRAARGGARDMVSLPDVGFGVSQALPIVVALRAASQDHTVYVEQPEIHLHPRAQVAMAGVLADAAKRGVNVVVETHSALLLKSFQNLVARGQLPIDLVKLHWFTRSETDGTTTIFSADLDHEGAYGDWPEDFGDVELEIEAAYLDAAGLALKNSI